MLEDEGFDRRDLRDPGGRGDPAEGHSTPATNLAKALKACQKHQSSARRRKCEDAALATSCPSTRSEASRREPRAAPLCELRQLRERLVGYNERMPEDYFGEGPAARYDDAVSGRFDPSVVDPTVEFLAELAVVAQRSSLESGPDGSRCRSPARIPVHGIDLSRRWWLAFGPSRAREEIPPR